MTDHSAAAVANAISLEVKKTGLSQGQGADWRLSFKLEESELCDRLRKAVMGTRYQMVLVELNEDETPKDHAGEAPKETPSRPPWEPAPVARPNSEATAAQAREPNSAPPARGRKSWDEMAPAQQAGILCADKSFLKFLGEYIKDADGPIGEKMDIDEDFAARAIRSLCGVKSRAAITKDNSDWALIMERYRTWQLAAKVVPV